VEWSQFTLGTAHSTTALKQDDIFKENKQFLGQNIPKHVMFDAETRKYILTKHSHTFHCLINRKPFEI